MKLIPLTQGQVTLVDNADYDWLNQWKWHADWAPTAGSYYAVRKDPNLGMVDGKDTRRTVLMHREILGLKHGDPRTGDHKSPKETLNNQRSNLRIAKNRTEQTTNQHIRSDNNSGFKGVSKRSRSKGYEARITVMGKTHSLGARDTPEAAFYELYVPAALELHGEFARLA